VGGEGTFLDLLPVVDLAVLALCVVKGEDGEFVGVLSGEDLCDEEAVGQVHAGVADGVGEIKTVQPLEDLAREGGSAAYRVQHLYNFRL
jgi:hypothetical protein